MNSPKACLKYFERPEVVKQISARLAADLELRLFQTFLMGLGDPIETMSTSNKDRFYLGLKPWLNYGTVQKSTVLWKNKRTDHLPVR